MKKLGKKIAAAGFGVALAFGALAVPSAATAQTTSTTVTSEVGEIQPFATYNRLVKCHIVDYTGGVSHTVGYVVAAGSGNTVAKAEKAARDDANAYLRIGEYPRHCQYSSNMTKWRLGVDRI